MQRQEVQEILLSDSGWIPSRRDLNYDNILKDEPRFRKFVEIPAEVDIYFEIMASSYTELWTRVGEILQEAYRDASLVGNLSGCRAVVKKAHDLAIQILKENNEYAAE